MVEMIWYLFLSCSHPVSSMCIDPCPFANIPDMSAKSADLVTSNTSFLALVLVDSARLTDLCVALLKMWASTANMPAL